MRIVMYSNRGPVRDHNEDALFAGGNIVAGCSMAAPLEVEAETSRGCLAVIDGMGGYEGGELAARLVAASLLETADAWRVSAKEGEERIEAILQNAVQRIANAVAGNAGLSSMGAALAGLVFCGEGDGEETLVFNCGDCRVYRCQTGYLEKLSHDHSVVQDLYDQGELDEEGMRTHPRKNIITACVSANPADLKVSFRALSRGQEGQRFFICSDGVWEALSIDDLEACVANHSASEAADMLAQKLNALGEECRDNVSFLIVET